MFTFKTHNINIVILRNVIFCILCLFHSSISFSDEKKVLSLNSYNNGYSWTDLIVSAERKTLRENLKEIDFFVEYMDTKRISGEEYFSLLKQIYKMKYRSTKFDVIICSDDDAFQFLLKYKPEIFPHIPVVFCGVNNFSPSMIAGRTDFTGYQEDIDAKSTIDLILKLHPATKRIVVISDGTVTGIAQRKPVQDLSARYPQIKFIYLNGEDLTNDMLIKKVTGLKEYDIALFTVWNIDKSGVHITATDILKHLANASPVPTYGFADSWLGLGIVGGKLNSASMHGKIAAQIGLEIIQGKKPADIPVMPRAPNQYMFDYNQIEKWGINVSLLPKDSIYINRPYSFYDKYKRIIWIVLSLIFIQTIIIIDLCLNIGRRKKAEKSLFETERKFRLILENASDILIFFNLKTLKYEYISPASFKISGYTPDELLSKSTIEILNMLYPLDKDKLLKRREAILQSRPDTDLSDLYLEYRMRTKSGDTLWISDKPEIIRDEQGTPIYVVLSGRDITFKKNAEEELKNQAEKLKEYNAMLERYAFISSHDMQEPLRIITTYLKLVQEKYSDKLDTEANNFIVRAIENSIRMRKLITDFLNFSRIGKTKPKRNPVDLNKIIVKILKNFEPLISESKAEIDIGNLPVLNVDENQFEILLSNLFDNAIKFRSMDRPLEIKFSSKLDISGWLFSLADNGIGIDPKFRDRIFLIFEKLSSRSDFLSTGMGLALAKKIVENHKGNIWVESVPDKGSVFYFTVPEINMETNKGSEISHERDS